MSRSSWKVPFVHPSIVKKISKNVESKKPIKIYSRSSTITPTMVGKIFSIYNGKKFFDITVSEFMIGKKMGEFSPTRSYKGHGKK